jgi:hypothetical protein
MVDANEQNNDHKKAPPAPRFITGDKVAHTAHGAGVVINHTDEWVQVRFDSAFTNDDEKEQIEDAFPQQSADLETL